MLSWVLPHVYIIDKLGLNDYVIARNPKLTSEMRMAHERVPPPGYVQCFQANVILGYRLVTISKRDVPFTADNIIACETKYRAWVNRHLH